MIISPFTPLFFPEIKVDGIDSRYIQTFATSDEILVEVIGLASEGTPTASIICEPSQDVLCNIQFSQWDINSNDRLFFATLNLSPGLYSVQIGDKRSTIFRITDNDAVLEKTTLIQYSMANNRQRKDAVFCIDGRRRFFDFRVPGGFKDSNWSFGVESEQFTTAESDIVQLYGLESTQKKFTLGLSDGCPIWFGELLNRLLTCTYVYFDGQRYARKDAAVPEITSLLDGLNSFVFSIQVQKVANIDPTLTMQHQAIMRRVIDNNYRLVTDNINRLIN